MAVKKLNCGWVTNPINGYWEVKEWAYFGFSLSFSSAILAHYKAGDPAFNLVAPFVMLLLLVVSYISYHKVMV